MEDAAEDRLVLEQEADGVGELELAAHAGFEARNGVEDAGCEHVAADDGEIRRCVGRGGLLYDRTHFDECVVHPLVRDRSVRGDLFWRYRQQRDHRRVPALMHFEHRAQQRRVVDHDVVAEQDGERLVADVFPRDRHGVTEAEWITLTDVVEVREVVDVTDLFEQRLLALLLEVVLELEVPVEMILDRVLAAARDHEDVDEPGAGRFFHDVLNRGLVDDRQHLLRLALGRGKESRAEAGRRDHRLAYRATRCGRRARHGPTLSPCVSGALRKSGSLPRKSRRRLPR